MTFAKTIEAIPANTSQGSGKGLAVSLVKALTHASLIRATEKAEYAAMDAKTRKAEFAAIAEHLDADHLMRPAYATEGFQGMLTNIHSIGKDLLKEHEKWTEDETKANLSLLIDRIMTICVNMDAELAGLEGASAGDVL